MPAVVRVVVPAYNAAAYVQQTLDSVAAQTFTAWECVVVDDGSTDGTADIVNGMVDVDHRFTLLRQRNGGLPHARNAGLRDLPPTVRFLAFLDADDLWLPDALERLVGALDGQPGAVGSYGLAEYVDEDGAPVRAGEHSRIQRDRRRIEGWRLRPVGPLEPMTFEEIAVVSALWPPSVGLYARAAVELVGGFDESLSSLEDWDFHLRMSRHGRYLPLDEHVVWYRQHAGQMTARGTTMALQYDRVRRRVCTSPANTRAQRQAALRGWRLVQVSRTRQAVTRLRTATRDHRWQHAGRLVLGTGVLALQALGRQPPRPHAWVVRLIHPDYRS